MPSDLHCYIVTTLIYRPVGAEYRLIYRMLKVLVRGTFVLYMPKMVRHVPVPANRTFRTNRGVPPQVCRDIWDGAGQLGQSYAV